MLKYLPPYESEQPLDEKLMIFWNFYPFSGNCLSFWEYVVANTDYKTIWIFDQHEAVQKMRECGGLCLHRDDPECAEYFAKAKYVVYEYAIPICFRKPKGQIRVLMETRVNFVEDIFLNRRNNQDDSYDQTIIARSNDADIFISNSSFFRAISAASNFINPKKVFITGSPRFDSMITSDGKALLHQLFPSAKKYSKLIIYCPSIRGFSGCLHKGNFEENFLNIADLNVNDLEAFLEKHNMAIICKLHPGNEFFPPTILDDLALPKHCYQLKMQDMWGKSIYHYLNAFDVMIADYSQLTSEYLLLNKPVIFNDLGLADSNDFNFVVEDEELIRPGSKFSNGFEFMHALQEAIEHPEYYADKRTKVIKMVHEYTDSKACERILNLMKNHVSVENLDYELFTSPIKEQLSYTRQTLADTQQTLADTQQTLADTQQTLADTRQTLADSQQMLDDVRSSREYRAMKKITKVICPPGSIRRKIAAKAASLIQKARRRLM